MKKTLVLGASTNPSRYSHRATRMLHHHGYEAIPVGVKKGSIDGVEIINGTPYRDDIDTVTLYLNPQRQKQYYDYILGLEPKRIIFNPGTENFELAKLAQERGIETEMACTLVMLSTGQY